MDTVTADLCIEINVDCPACGNYFDLLIDTELNDEGGLLYQVIADERWKIEQSERLHCSPTCPSCKTTFEVKGINW